MTTAAATPTGAGDPGLRWPSRSGSRPCSSRPRPGSPAPWASRTPCPRPAASHGSRGSSASSPARRSSSRSPSGSRCGSSRSRCSSACPSSSRTARRPGSRWRAARATSGSSSAGSATHARKAWSRSRPRGRADPGLVAALSAPTARPAATASGCGRSPTSWRRAPPAGGRSRPVAVGGAPARHRQAPGPTAHPEQAGQARST